MNRTMLLVLGAIAAVVITLGGLSALVLGTSGGDDNGSTPSSTTTTGDNNGDEGEPAGSGELRLIGDDPLTLDPALAGDVTSATYIVEVYSGLLTLGPQLQLEPDIAESYDVSADGLSYTFHLRDNATFHQGRRVTANDFKYSMERSASPTLASPLAEAYLGDIVGAKDYIRGRADSISGIEVVDDSTLKITIDAPKPYFPLKLTYPTAFVVDKNQIESNPDSWTRRPNGTGPFMIDEYQPGERMTLKAFSRYHLGAPKLETVTYLLAAGSSTTMYENNEIDVSFVPIDFLQRAEDVNDPLNKEYVKGDELSTSYIGFNTKAPPFDDPKVRQAFATAIDKARLVSVVLRNGWRQANGILPPQMPGFNPELAGLTFDAAQAKKLLSESKYGGPEGLPPIQLTETGAGANIGNITEAILAMWKENLGVDVRVQQVETATFFSDLDRGRFQMFSLGWIADYPDPENFLDLKFHSGSRQNDTQYSNPEVDAILDQARTEADPTRRLALYDQAEEMIVNDAPWIPLFHGASHNIVKPYVKGWLETPLVVPRLRFVSIER